MSAKIDLSNAAVLGAAGKMGRGIALLLLQHLNDDSLLQGRPPSYHLHCIDGDAAALVALRCYLRSGLRRHAEKNIVALRAALCRQGGPVSNEEVVEYYTEAAMDRAFCAGEALAAASSSVVFEALPELPSLKVETLMSLGRNARLPQLILSNTSSIPIGLLSEASRLQGAIAGFHFYNPAPVQKLVELVFPSSLSADKQQALTQLADRLGKTAVVARDIPGFIGNGFFIREIAFINRVTERFAAMVDLPSALWALNHITEEWLLWPMGIYQLIDYVGLDVCLNIMDVMKEYLGDRQIDAPLLRRLLAQGRRGGQDVQGRTKEGFFQYDEAGRPQAVWNAATQQYQSLEQAALTRRTAAALGTLPPGHHPWKALHSRRDKDELLKAYLENLCLSTETGALLALEVLRYEYATASMLSDSKVAQSLDDVNTVMKLGFHRLYGPAESWLPPMVTTAHLEELMS